MRILLFLTMAAAAFAQEPPSYTVTRTSSLSSAAEVITIQQPTTPIRKVQFQTAYVYCSVACTFTVERDGTAATATTLTPAAVNPLYRASTVSGYRSSDVGSGTSLSAYSLAAGGEKILEMGDKFLIGGGENLTIRTSSITGTVIVNIQWKESTR